VLPIGIDVEAFAAMAHTQEAEERIQRLHRRATARVHIIGVDRLDYMKGLPERPVVLLTDGEETCGGAPCALGKWLKANLDEMVISIRGGKY
jgi:Glycosyltransferase family 20